MQRCLVIDDSRVMRKVARAILEDLRFDISEADGADAALVACREQMPELILLNLNLPKTHGVEFLRRLRKERGGDRPFVVFATVENDVGKISEALGAGANDYVMKPFDRESLQAKLASAGLI